MDEEHTSEYSEPCPRCSERLWGVTDEGHFFCKSCHNVIERMTEAVEPNVPGSSRMSSIRKGPRAKRAEGGRQWVVCEGFQFILKAQAEALVQLGADPKFKDEVLVRLWRQYLQKTRQAYTHEPEYSASFRLSRPGSDSEAGPDSGSGLDPESGLDSGSELDSRSGPGSQVNNCDSDSTQVSTVGSAASTPARSDWSVGSVDGEAFVAPSGRRRKWRTGQMSMRKTLALLHVALVWSRQKITLTDLLSLVEKGLVPYLNAYELFPEEMKLNNKDGAIFRVLSIPTYSVIHSKSKDLIRFLQLPAFPPITSKSPLHPLNLSRRFLLELNLPDEMLQWVELILDQGDLLSPERLTVDPGASPRPGLPHYELFAAAAIVVCMKLLFGLDDKTEWELSSDASADKSGNVFSLRKWYRLLQPALLRGQRRRLQLKARKQWVPKKPLYFTQDEKIVALKRRRVSEQLTSCFKSLSSNRHSDTQSADQGGEACSFHHFLWGRSPGADGRCMRHMTLKGGARTEVANHISENYWHPPFTNCHRCRGHLSLLRADVPRMFLWLLDLFSFVLRLSASVLFEVVVKLERKLFQIQNPRSRLNPKVRERRTARSRSRT